MESYAGSVRHCIALGCNHARWCPYCCRPTHTARTAAQGRLSSMEFFNGKHTVHPGAPGVPSMRPSSAVAASFYRSRRDPVAEQQLAMQHRIQGSSRRVVAGGESPFGSLHEGLAESLDISPLAPAAPGSTSQ